MSLSDRLRDVIRPVNGDRRSPSYAGGGGNPSARVRSRVQASDDIADTLGGEWCEDRGRRYLVVDRTYGPGHRHGHVTIADAMPGGDDAWPRLALLARAPLRGRLLFFDLETTGLAGGAGTYAFLVGCGWFEPPSPRASAGQVACFRTRQFFLSAFGAEAAMLSGLAGLAAGAGGLVTYNGKSFDLPLIDNRFVLHRMPTPLRDLPHVDMLHPARRLWRDPGPAPGHDASTGCRLTALERTQCGFERDGDVPGFEIPSRYFAYVHSGDGQPLRAVLEHNRLDLISLAMLTARTAQMLEEGPAAARSGREALGLGRLYEQGSLAADAWASYAVAAGLREWAGACVAPYVDSTTRAEALRACALLSRRQQRYEDATDAWQRLLDVPNCPAAFAREAMEALAVHHEHRLHDAATARHYASQALLFPSTTTRHAAARHRLSRLDQKLLAGLGGPTLPEKGATATP